MLRATAYLFQALLEEIVFFSYRCRRQKRRTWLNHYWALLTSTRSAYSFDPETTNDRSHAKSPTQHLPESGVKQC